MHAPPHSLVQAHLQQELNRIMWRFASPAAHGSGASGLLATKHVLAAVRIQRWWRTRHAEQQRAQQAKQEEAHEQRQGGGSAVE